MKSRTLHKKYIYSLATQTLVQTDQSHYRIHMIYRNRLIIVVCILCGLVDVSRDLAARGGGRFKLNPIDFTTKFQPRSHWISLNILG